MPVVSAVCIIFVFCIMFVMKKIQEIAIAEYDYPLPDSINNQVYKKLVGNQELNTGLFNVE